MFFFLFFFVVLFFSMYFSVWFSFFNYFIVFLRFKINKRHQNFHYSFIIILNQI